MSANLVVRVDPLLDEEEVRASVEASADTAFEEALMIAQASGISTGDPEFDELYRNLAEAYAETTEYATFYVSVGLATLQTLLESELLQLRSFGSASEDFEEIVARSLKSLAVRIAASHIHVIACANSMRIPNEAFNHVPKELRELTFTFEGIHVVEKGDEHDSH